MKGKGTSTLFWLTNAGAVHHHATVFHISFKLFSNYYLVIPFNINVYVKCGGRDFPGGAVVNNPPTNAGDTGLSPGPGRSHMPWSNQARVPQLLSLCSRAREPHY